MEFTAQQIADYLGGIIVGDPERKVSKFSKIDQSEENSLTFLSNPKYSKFLKNSSAAIIVVSKDYNIAENEPNKTFILVDDAHVSFTSLLSKFHKNGEDKSGISRQAAINSTAIIHPDGVFVGDFVTIEEGAQIGKNVKIYQGCYIGEGVKIGSGSVLYPGVKLYKNTQIGENCIIHTNSTIGSDGFGFQPRKDGSFEKIYHIGNVVIEDDVEIGAGCTIDRATVGSTLIKKGVKLDNQIQVAHNVEIGENTVIASQSGIAGSTKIGRNVMIGGQVGITGHLVIGDFVQIQAQSGVNSDVPAGTKLYGSPAMNAADFRKSYVIFRKLPELYKVVSRLEKLLTTEKQE